MTPRWRRPARRSGRSSGRSRPVAGVCMMCIVMQHGHAQPSPARAGTPGVRSSGSCSVTRRSSSAPSPRTPRPGSGWATSIRISPPWVTGSSSRPRRDDPARSRRRLPRAAARRVRRAGRPAARGHRRRRLRRRLPADRRRGVAGVLRNRPRRHLAVRAAGAADPRRVRPRRAEGRHPDRGPGLLPDRLLAGARARVRGGAAGARRRRHRRGQRHVRRGQGASSRTCSARR